MNEKAFQAARRYRELDTLICAAAQTNDHRRCATLAREQSGLRKVAEA